MDTGCRLSTSSIQGKVSSIPTVLSWIDSISSDGFLPCILLVVVIMVTVIIVAVVLEIFVVVIVGVVIVVASGWAYAFHQDKASLVRVPVANVILSSSAHLLRENTDSVRSYQQMSPTAPSVPLK
nr:hypothetical protein [Tanacetum cinerariifolium]